MGVTRSNIRLQGKHAGLTAWNGAEKTWQSVLQGAKHLYFPFAQKLLALCLGLYQWMLDILVMPHSHHHKFLPSVHFRSHWVCMRQAEWVTKGLWEKWRKPRWWLRCRVWVSCLSGSPVALPGDHTLLFLHRAMLGGRCCWCVHNACTHCGALSFIGLFSKCLCLLSQISNCCSYCCCKHFGFE